MDIDEAIELAETIIEFVAEHGDSVGSDGQDFFESVREKALSMLGTLESFRESGRAPSAAQCQALENMYRGLKRWVHHD